MLVGNKKDKENREVPYNLAAKYAMEHNFGLMEVSAKLGHGVKEAFNRLVAEVYRSMQDEIIEDNGQETHLHQRSLNSGSLILDPANHYKFAGTGSQSNFSVDTQPTKKKNKCCKSN